MNLRRILATLVIVVAIASSNTTSRAELLTNGGFDDISGTFVGWTYSGSVFNRNNEGATSGTYAAVFNPNELPTDGVLSQTFATVAGTGYYFTFDYGYYASATNPQSLEVTVNGATTLLDQIVTTSGTANANPASFLSYNFVFTADSSTAVLSFTDKTLNGSGSDGVLDSASINLVPEPSSMVLCGFAGLIGTAYAWRRKARATC